MKVIIGGKRQDIILTVTDGPASASWYGYDGFWHHVMGETQIQFEANLSAEEAQERANVAALKSQAAEK